MLTVPVEVSEPRPRRRAVARPAARPAARPVAKKTKVTLVLDDELAKRLAVYAALTSQERSSVVGQLIRDHLRRFRVADLGERGESEVQGVSAD